jgi:ABC-type branched-subunit amino acid transport system substrate-binding protein
VAQRAGKPVKFAFLFEDSPRGAGTIDASRKLLKEKGLVPVIEVSYNRAERNLLPQVKKVEQAAPDIVVWAGYTEDVVAGLKAMQQIAFTPYVVGIGGGPGSARSIISTPTWRAPSGSPTRTRSSTARCRAATPRCVTAARTRPALRSKAH